MKDKIREILVKHSDNKNANDRIEAELLDLFSVSNSLPLTQREDYLKGWEDGVEYANNTKKNDC